MAFFVSFDLGHPLARSLANLSWQANVTRPSCTYMCSGHHS